MYVGFYNFYEIFLRGIIDLETVSKVVFKKYKKSRNLFYCKK
jgi:hypothetical protein